MSRTIYPLQIDITNACNLACNHCYHSNHKNNGALSLAEIFGAINQYLEICRLNENEPYVLLCGGEPLLNRDIFQIINYIQDVRLLFGFQRKISIKIITNGTLITENILEKLDSSIVNFQISVDGHDRESHDYARGKGNFSKTIKGIAKLIKHGFTFDILSILSFKSQLSLIEVIDLAEILGARSIGFVRLVENGFALTEKKSNQDRTLTKEELLAAYKVILSESKKRQRIQVSTGGPLFNILDSKAGSYSNYELAICIDYRGNVLFSSRSRYILGSIREKSLSDILNHSELLTKMKFKQDNKCYGCEYFNKCGGDRNAAFFQSGSFFDIDPGCFKDLIKKENVA